MNAPANLKYTKSDEWFDPESGKAGLSDYAQSQLSDIVFVEILVDEGDTVEAGKPIASVESVKSTETSCLIAPCLSRPAKVSARAERSPTMMRDG